MHLEEKTLSSEQKFDGKIVKLYVDSVELEDGKKSFREVIKHPGGVCVLPLDEEGNVLFVRQFRYPHKKVSADYVSLRKKRAAPATGTSIWEALSPRPRTAGR